MVLQANRLLRLLPLVLWLSSAAVCQAIAGGAPQTSCAHCTDDAGVCPGWEAPNNARIKCLLSSTPAPNPQQQAYQEQLQRMQAAADAARQQAIADFERKKAENQRLAESYLRKAQQGQTQTAAPEWRPAADAEGAKAAARMVESAVNEWRPPKSYEYSELVGTAKVSLVDSFADSSSNESAIDPTGGTAKISLVDPFADSSSSESGMDPTAALKPKDDVGASDVLAQCSDQLSACLRPCSLVAPDRPGQMSVQDAQDCSQRCYDAGERCRKGDPSAFASLSASADANSAATDARCQKLQDYARGPMLHDWQVALTKYGIFAQAKNSAEQLRTEVLSDRPPESYAPEVKYLSDLILGTIQTVVPEGEIAAIGTSTMDDPDRVYKILSAEGDLATLLQDGAGKVIRDICIDLSGQAGGPLKILAAIQDYKETREARDAAKDEWTKALDRIDAALSNAQSRINQALNDANQFSAINSAIQRLCTENKSHPPVP